MRRPILILLAVLAIGACRCSSTNEDPAPVIRPQPGAELCGEACNHIGPDGLNCEEGLPVMIPIGEQGTVECEPDAGALECISCEEFCVEQHKKGIYWNTSCIAEVTACEEIETVCNDGGGV